MSQTMREAIEEYGRTMHSAGMDAASWDRHHDAARREREAAEMLDAILSAPSSEQAQQGAEPYGWLYDWTHSSALGKPDEHFTGFTTDEAHARKHENVRAVCLASRPASAAPAVGVTDATINRIADGLFDHQEIGGKVPAQGKDGWRELVGSAIAEYAALAGAAQGAEPVESIRLRAACSLHTHHVVMRYLMSCADGRWDGHEKALRHRELCDFYVAMAYGLDDASRAQGEKPEVWEAVHNATQALTDNMDEVIGFPLKGRPDYDKLAPLFFDQFHALALQALAASPQPPATGYNPKRDMAVALGTGIAPQPAQWPDGSNYRGGD